MKSIDFKDFREFKQTLLKSLKISERFTIVCQNHETEEIETALKFGEIRSCDEGHCKIIEGKVTQEFISFFEKLEMPKFKRKNMMPFYTLILDDKIYFENYAKENYIK